MSIKFFKTKKECIRENEKQRGLIANYGIKKYFIVKDYGSLLGKIQETSKKSYFEFIPDTIPVKLFFDIEIFKEKNLEWYNNPRLVIDVISREYGNEYILLESHKRTVPEKQSYHIIFPNVIFSNVLGLKRQVMSSMNLLEFMKEKVIDTSVYREGLFRTLYSSKEGEDRPLMYSNNSPIKDADLDTFICNIKGENGEFYDKTLEEKVRKPLCCSRGTSEVVKRRSSIMKIEDIKNEDKLIVYEYIKMYYNYNYSDIVDYKIGDKFICIGLKDKFCRFKKMEHKSNHQYIIIDMTGSKQKCHDIDCSNDKWNAIVFDNLPTELKNMLYNTFQISVKEIECIEKAKTDYNSYVIDNFQDKNVDFEYDRSLQKFHSNADSSLQHYLLCCKCSRNKCNMKYVVEEGNSFKMICTECNSAFPNGSSIMNITDSKKYSNASNFWTQINVTNNNITYIGEESFACDVALDNSILKNKEVTDLVNQILDGHKISKISQLLKIKFNDFVFDTEWYHFNGFSWNIDKDTLILKKCILDLSIFFDKIQQHYIKKGGDNEKIIHNIKTLIIKINKPGFKKEIVEECKIFYHQDKFHLKLNSKKHLVPFTNGVFDLLENKFRITKKEDYVSLLMNYEYNIEVDNNELHEFLGKVLPVESVRKYVLKKMSECLNGDIPNTKFLMFIGNGANGKSQLLNLMKYTMSDFGEKVEVTLLTRKRNNANESNTEKIKLLGKRFAYLSEPEDSEKINISLLKELTGSEEIVARGLYEGSQTFIMEAKLFLACNELPEIKGEDNALWRRIRVIDFPSSFVESPEGEHEYMIDTTLPSRLREDVTWRQTFMNTLIHYYYQNIMEPQEVQLKTNQYKDDNDIVMEFLSEKCNISVGNKNMRVDASSLWTCFKDWMIECNRNCKIKSKQFKDRINKITKYVYEKPIRIAGITNPVQGWMGIELKK
jgi:P4 family phage/plasmid primase-like protien